MTINNSNKTRRDSFSFTQVKVHQMCASVIATAISNITAMTFLKHWTQNQGKMVSKEKHFLKGWTFWNLEILIVFSVFRNLLQIPIVCVSVCIMPVVLRCCWNTPYSGSRHIKKTWCLTSTETTMLIRDGEKGGRGYGGGGRERLHTYRYTVTTRMIPALRWAAMRAILLFQ